MRHHDGDNVWEKVAHALLRLIDAVLDKLTASETPTSKVVLDFNQGAGMADVVVTLGTPKDGTIGVVDSVTGATVTADAGSVVASLVDGTTATATVSADQLTVTLTGVLATVPGTPNTLTVAASVNGVASTPATQDFDVVAASDATHVVLTFA